MSPPLPRPQPGEEEPDLLADFTFDDAETGFAGGSAVAKINGTYELRDSKDAQSGKPFI